MLRKIRDNWFWSIILAAYLSWMGFVSFAAYQAMSNDKMNSVLHGRISSTKEEITLETNAKILDLKQQNYVLQEHVRELREMFLEFIVGKCPDTR